MPQNRRDNGKNTRFKPGNCANPGGRPKQTPEQKDALQKIRALAPDAVNVLEDMLYNSKTPANLRMRAIEIILERTYGKPESSVKVDASLDSPDFVLRILPDDADD